MPGFFHSGFAFPRFRMTFEAPGLDTFEADPISTFALKANDFSRLGQRLGALGLPTVFVLEGGYAAAALGIHAVNVLKAFEEA